MKALFILFIMLFGFSVYANDEPKEGDKVCYAIADGEAAYVVGWHNKSIDLAKEAALKVCKDHFKKECSIEVCFTKQ